MKKNNILKLEVSHIKHLSDCYNKTTVILLYNLITYPHANGGTFLQIMDGVRKSFKNDVF